MKEVEAALSAFKEGMEKEAVRMGKERAVLWEESYSVNTVGLKAFKDGANEFVGKHLECFGLQAVVSKAWCINEKEQLSWPAC